MHGAWVAACMGQRMAHGGRTPALRPDGHTPSPPAAAGPSVDFVPSEKNLNVKWHPEQIDVMDWATNVKVSAPCVWCGAWGAH